MFAVAVNVALFREYWQRGIYTYLKSPIKTMSSAWRPEVYIPDGSLEFLKIFIFYTLLTGTLDTHSEDGTPATVRGMRLQPARGAGRYARPAAHSMERAPLGRRLLRAGTRWPTMPEHPHQRRRMVAFLPEKMSALALIHI